MLTDIMASSCSRSDRMNPDLEVDDLRDSPTGQETQGDHELVVQIGLKDGDTQEDQNFPKSPSNFPDSHELVDHQEVVSITNGHSINGLLNLSADHQVQVLTNSGVTTVTDSNGAIYLLVSNDTTGTMVHTSTAQESGINIISSDTLKDLDLNSNSTVQIMNTEGIPVTINVNDLLTTINASKNTMKDDNSLPCSSTQNILNLSSVTSTESSTQNSNITNPHQRDQQNEQYLFNAAAGLPRTQLTNVPNWALHLRGCCLYGDTYTGYVTDEIEMDNVLNLYKKETQSLFAIRQTPSPSKDESSDTVRLMWKSQYVPYDGIPFVNVGRRATVMECEYGPRKRNNALKRMIQQHPHQNSINKIPNLTCPARLFVKKVRKFPQYRVPSDSDQKVLRQLQEQALKIVRQTGFQTGEIRLYMQLPLPSAHRYHHVGSSSLETFHREVDDSNLIIDSLAVDSRVLEKIEEIVRQGFVNPFLVRGAAKDFVENHIELGALEQPPYKHNKEFYPPLIEIQNIIQQTQAALTSGLLTPLPPPDMPYVHTQKPKRKRSVTEELNNSPLLLKKMAVDPKKYSDAMVSPTIPSEIGSVSHTKTLITDSTISAADAETISLTLTDSQLENLSVSNFTYSQLAQLAKIGLLALNNAAKDTTQITTVDPQSLKTEPDLDIRTKNTTLVNSPLPDCEPGAPLLVSCNARDDKKIIMLRDDIHDSSVVVSGAEVMGDIGNNITYK